MAKIKDIFIEHVAAGSFTHSHFLFAFLLAPAHKTGSDLKFEILTEVLSVSTSLLATAAPTYKSGRLTCTYARQTARAKNSWTVSYHNSVFLNKDFR